MSLGPGVHVRKFYMAIQESDVPYFSRSSTHVDGGTRTFSKAYHFRCNRPKAPNHLGYTQSVWEAASG